MNKTKFRKQLFLSSAALIIALVQVIPYIVAQTIVVSLDLKTYDLTLPIDLKIPLIPAFIIIYLGWFFFLAIEYISVSKDIDSYDKFLTASAIGGAVCFVLFVVYPVEMVRPEIPQTGLFVPLMNVTYSADHPVNLFPSMHCFASWMCFISNRAKQAGSKFRVAISLSMTILICLSTLFVKQHIVLDVVSGIALAELCYAVARIRDFSHPARKFYKLLGKLI